MFPILQLCIFWTCIAFISSHQIQISNELENSQSSNIITLLDQGNNYNFETITDEKIGQIMTIPALKLEESNQQDQNTRESTKLLVGISVSIGIIVILIIIISIILLVNLG